MGANRIFGFCIRNGFRTVRGKTVFGDSCDKFQIWRIYVFNISQFANDGGFKFVSGREKLSEAFSFKVFRYSFFGTTPNFLNRLLDSPFLVRSKWNLQYLLVLDWALARFTFCGNRYFHDNEKQKTSKTLKLKFSAIQKMVHKIYKNRKSRMFVLK